MNTHNAEIHDDHTGQWYECRLGHRNYICPDGSVKDLSVEWGEAGFESRAEAIDRAEKCLPPYFACLVEIVSPFVIPVSYGWYLSPRAWEYEVVVEPV